ncbi:hypothetical protein GA0061070_103347 [Kosakonia oryziphila]|uniref:Uncharacterized protein n=1 Tax=Kosakonia oryziphila TaxID=1005667 RepID=A0A1C4F9H5_9ENTR|nr:hypothetical protein GA0061070_103347 [Kosakonia oryziphila]
MLKLYGIFTMPGRIFRPILAKIIRGVCLTRFKRSDYKRSLIGFHLVQNVRIVKKCL